MINKLSKTNLRLRDKVIFVFPFTMSLNYDHILTQKEKISSCKEHYGNYFCIEYTELILIYYHYHKYVF